MNWRKSGELEESQINGVYFAVQYIFFLTERVKGCWLQKRDIAHMWNEHFHSCEHHIAEMPQSNAKKIKIKNLWLQNLFYLKKNNGMYKTIELKGSISIVIMFLIKWLNELRGESEIEK